MTNKIINVDACGWTTSHDIYNTILPRLGSPDWHGDSVNALTESMVWGEINAVEPPYTLRIHGTANLPAEVAEEIGWLKEDVAKACEEYRLRHGHDAGVRVEILP